MTQPTFQIKKTKIIATLGPACSDKETLLSLIKEGTNVFRINFSHATHEDSEEKIKLIREINQEYGFNTSILGDLQGPKLRIGKMEDGVVLKKGDILTFTNEKIVGNAKKVYMTYKQFAKDVSPGEKILVDDGKLLFEVIKTNQVDTVEAKVIQGGKLKSKKGVNLPNTKVSLPALTEKDLEDAAFALDQNLDWIALSFVRDVQDVQDLRDLISKHQNKDTKIISKIEKPEAILNIDAIIEASDALMVARGDLGVEIPMEEVPLAQKSIVQKAKKAQKPVIIATQMMESMITSMTPTRAEVNDVANSVLDGADAVMLSGETSVGEFPVEVISAMRKIILNVEDHHLSKLPLHPPVNYDSDRYLTDTVCYSAVQMANNTNANAIVALTFSGYTAYEISSQRPKSHILIFTPNKKLLTQLNLLWGVTAFLYEKLDESTDESVLNVNKIAFENKFVGPDDYIINLNAMPLIENGKTNTVRISKIQIEN
ncbi:MAG: pyruvate kinase [Flavobacteriaceae bacterium]|nr:MAG: pyruvate kinase [Flavobacteriaceae bacterium]